MLYIDLMPKGQVIHISKYTRLLSQTQIKLNPGLNWLLYEDISLQSWIWSRTQLNLCPLTSDWKPADAVNTDRESILNWRNGLVSGTDAIVQNGRMLFHKTKRRNCVRNRDGRSCETCNFLNATRVLSVFRKSHDCATPRLSLWHIN